METTNNTELDTDGSVLRFARIGPNPGATKPASVLIVDQCPEIRAVIRATVGDLVAEIWEAEDSCEAVEAYIHYKPTWVTLDLYLEPFNGLTTMRIIKSGNPAARVVIVSAYDYSAFREVAKLRGASGYVSKFDLWKIRELIAPSTIGSPFGKPAASGNLQLPPPLTNPPQ